MKLVNGELETKEPSCQGEMSSGFVEKALNPFFKFYLRVGRKKRASLIWKTNLFPFALAGQRKQKKVGKNGQRKRKVFPTSFEVSN